MSQLKVNTITDEVGTGAPDFTSGLKVNGNSLPTSGPLSNRNKIINGAMTIDQRNAGAAVTPTSNAQYVLDRWFPALSVASKYSVQRTTASAPIGFSHATLITSLSAYSPLAADFLYYGQKIEGHNVADLNWGTANASTITVSFWVRSSLTGVFSVRLVNSGFDRSYVTTYTINSADTWEKKTITVSGDTSGTWETNSNTGIELSFDLGSGSNYTTSTLNSWQAGSVAKASGSVSVLATSGATFYLTGVQLEAGDTATPFEHRSYGQELALCQRYYYLPDGGQFGTIANNTTYAAVSYPFPVTMRANPTFSGTSATMVYTVPFVAGGATGQYNSVEGIGKSSSVINYSGLSRSDTAGTLIVVNTSDVQFSAEL